MDLGTSKQSKETESLAFILLAVNLYIREVVK